MVRDEVMRKVGSSDLSCFVVWLPMLPGDSLKSAQVASGLARDPRTTQLYASDKQMFRALGQPLGLNGEVAWDVYLAFGRDAHAEDSLPAPDFFMHQLHPLPERLFLNGQSLRAQIVRLLQEGESSARDEPVSSDASAPRCTLSEEQQSERAAAFARLLQSSGARIREHRDGFEFEFVAERAPLPELIEFVQLERQCCPFFGFELKVPADGQAVRFRIRAPVDAKAWLKQWLEGRNLQVRRRVV